MTTPTTPNKPILKRFEPRDGFPAVREAMAWNATRCGLDLETPEAWFNDTLYEPSDAGGSRYRFVLTLLTVLGPQWFVSRLASPRCTDGLTAGTTVVLSDPHTPNAPAYIAQISQGQWLDPDAIPEATA